MRVPIRAAGGQIKRVGFGRGSKIITIPIFAGRIKTTDLGHMGCQRVGRQTGRFYPNRVPIIKISPAKAVQVAAVGIHHKDLAVTGTGRPEHNLFAVRRPGGLSIHFGNKRIFANFAGIKFLIAAGQLQQVTAIPIHHPNFIISAVVGDKSDLVGGKSPPGILTVINTLPRSIGNSLRKMQESNSSDFIHHLTLDRILAPMVNRKKLEK